MPPKPPDKNDLRAVVVCCPDSASVSDGASDMDPMMFTFSARALAKGRMRSRAKSEDDERSFKWQEETNAGRSRGCSRHWRLPWLDGGLL